MRYYEVIGEVNGHYESERIPAGCRREALRMAETGILADKRVIGRLLNSEILFEYKTRE
ncbi:MAG: hypothetical protein NT076_04455 [Candidatus Pacearchaeota archaeon]|nr:hypothetical protein [Candidatus Pacearchaeota archaeon]